MENDDVEFSPSEALLVLQQAVCSFYVSNSLKGMSDTAYINSRDVFFFSFIAAIEGFPKEGTSLDGALQQLHSVLSSWKFTRVPVPGDGNCLFMAVGLAILQRIQTTDQFLTQRLLTLGLPMEQMHDVNRIVELLRICMVKEWIDNTDYYQGFVTADITAVAHQYLASGQFTGDMGDLMVLTLSNVLQTPITIFTSITNMPVICITPTMQVAGTAQPLFLTFIHSGPGHYDYAINIPTEQSSSESSAESLVRLKPKITKCTCGRKVGFTAKACSTERCPCVRTKKYCTSLCRCKDCTNQYGTRPPPSTTRKRASYDTQRQPLCGVPADTFMKKVGETSRQGHLTLLEVMVLKALIVYFIVHGFTITTDNLLCCYEHVVRVAQLTEVVDFPLSTLVKQRIEIFLQQLCGKKRNQRFM